jgi:hypothetical protein
MNIFKGSWKTTSAGLLMIAGGLVHIGFSVYHKTLTENDVMAQITLLVGGLGLLFARDNNKSSEDVGAK